MDLTIILLAGTLIIGIFFLLILQYFLSKAIDNISRELKIVHETLLNSSFLKKMSENNKGNQLDPFEENWDDFSCE